MKNKLFFLVIISICIISCSNEKQQDGIIARINGDVLTESMLLEMVGVSDSSEITDSVKRQKIDEWIKITLLAQEADRRELSSNETIQSRIELAEKSIKANLMLAHLFEQIIPDENELFNYYQIHQSRYSGRDYDEYNIQRIAFNSDTEADLVSKRIVNGELNFTEAVRTFSVEPARNDDGYLGYMSLNEMDAPMRRAINNLSQWRFMKIRSGNNFYLVRYTDSRTVRGQISFVESYDKVKYDYIEENKKELVETLIEILISNSEVIISG